MSRVLVSRFVYPEAIELLERAHLEIDYHDYADGLDREQFLSRVSEADALLCQLTDDIDAETLSAGGKLQIVATVAVGYDNIDIAAAARLGVVVTNTPGVLTETTADFTWALMLAAARRVVEADAFLREGRWQQWQVDLLCGHDLHGRTLGIVGIGRIGQGVARRARGFDMKLLYTSRSRNRELEAELGLEWRSKNALLAESDFVTLHVPLNESTHHWIDAAALEAMKESAILVNTTRGPVVDEVALVAALEQRQIAGAALDVFEKEPQVPERLLNLDNVVIAPHIASASIATRTRMCCMAAESIVAHFAGKPVPNRVLAEGLSR